MCVFAKIERRRYLVYIYTYILKYIKNRIINITYNIIIIKYIAHPKELQLLKSIIIRLEMPRLLPDSWPDDFVQTYLLGVDLKLKLLSGFKFVLFLFPGRAPRTV